MKRQAEARNSDKADVDRSFVGSPIKLTGAFHGESVEFCEVTNSKFEPMTRNLAGQVSYQAGKTGFTYDMTSACAGGPAKCNDYFVVATKGGSGEIKLYSVAIRYKSH